MIKQTKRPCIRKHPIVNPTVTKEQCYLCWLAVNVRHYQRKWGLPETGEYEHAPNARIKKERVPKQSNTPKVTKTNKPEARKAYSLPCINEGAILEYCTKCRKDVKHVRECTLHDKATRILVSDKVRACSQCSDYKPNTELY